MRAVVVVLGLLAVVLGLAVWTIVGALVVWALSVFGLVAFSWLKAFALGVCLGTIAGFLK